MYFPFALFRRSTFTGEACPFLELCMFCMAGVEPLEGPSMTILQQFHSAGLEVVL